MIASPSSIVAATGVTGGGGGGGGGGKKSKKKSSAIVIDLDETLLYSTMRAVEKKKPDYQYGDLLGYHRPGATEFLRYCRAQFEFLIVFTAGAPNYASAMVESLQKRSGIRFDFVFDRRACVEETENTAFREYFNRYVKHLVALKNSMLPKEIAERIDWDDTLLIDDLAHNARENLQQALMIPKFSRRTTESLDSDDWLARLQRFIDAKPADVKWCNVERVFWFLY